MFLNEMKKGCQGQVADFSEQGLKHQVRYLSLGLIPGANIEVIRVAPLGCPMEVKVNSTLLSIRKTEASEIIVEASE